MNSINLKKIMLFCFAAISLSSCSQKKMPLPCLSDVDSLYSKYGKHLLFCCYYNDSISTLVRADTIYSLLPYYKEEVNDTGYTAKDKMVIANLKMLACNKDSLKMKEVRKWCAVSLQLEEIRKESAFTLDGYMDFLSEEKSLSALLELYLTGDRSTGSLADNEMENIYFSSIGLITGLPENEKNDLLKKLRHWMGH